jgi:cell division protein ZapD
MNTILYEHPLNERIRNYLKLEQLFVQATGCLQYDVNISYTTYFSALFAILDTLERNDIRGDLTKDLEKLEQNLVIWSKAPDIDTRVLQENLQSTVRLVCGLKSRKLDCLQLKEHKFLSPLKQRFAMQGGCASFDLPQLHFWLYRPQETLIAEMQSWLDLLRQINDSLALVLKFIRQRSGFVTIETQSSFYQDSGDGLLLLRIRVPKTDQHYPVISGNKMRYSIRFMLPCEIKGRRYSNQAATFQIARC